MPNEKQELIRSMIEMQKKFIALEKESGMSVQDYFAPSNDHPLADYSKNYGEKANRLLDLAHQEKGSKR